jgi:hypothetical protein
MELYLAMFLAARTEATAGEAQNLCLLQKADICASKVFKSGNNRVRIYGVLAVLLIDVSVARRRKVLCGVSLVESGDDEESFC